MSFDFDEATVQLNAQELYILFLLQSHFIVSVDSWIEKDLQKCETKKEVAEAILKYKRMCEIDSDTKLAALMEIYKKRERKEEKEDEPSDSKKAKNK